MGNATRPLGEDISTTTEETPARLFAGALVLTLGNPKVMVFFLALLPTVVDLSDIGVRSYFEIAVAICTILAGVLTTYSIAAVRARRLFKDVRAVRWLNRGSGGVMAGAALIVATQ